MELCQSNAATAQCLDSDWMNLSLLHGGKISRPATLTPNDLSNEREKMAAYRKRPVVIEAVQLAQAGEDPSEDVLDWLHARSEQWESDRDEGIAIKTLEGVMRADPGDWIIEGVNGELYPCKPDIFAKSYEPVTQTT